MIWLWGQFVACAGLIVGAGVFLVKFGDAIAERTGLGHLWAGAILVATATSLPELFTGVGSVLIFDVPDLAVGTLLGSCVINLLILVALDVLAGSRSFFDGVNPAYIVEAAFALVLTVIVALGLFLAKQLRTFPWVWPGSLLVPVVYVFAVRVTMREGRYPPFVQDLDTYRSPAAAAKPAARPKHLPTLRRALAGYGVSAAVVIAASLWLPGVAEGIAEGTGIGTTVIGGILVALTTSLPEIVTTVAAFRIGAADMAFSNVIGSNLFNILVLALDDLLYLRGPLTSSVSGAQLATAIIAIGMTGAVIVALAVRRQRKFLRLSWASLVLIAGFILNVVAVSLLS
jgi:cation:H+ antiporter